MDNQLTPGQKDALKEVVTIGAGNAATALSQIVKKKISIEVPRVNLITIDKVPDIFGGAEVLVTTVYLQVLGDVSGVILFSFHKDEANKLADLLLEQQVGKTKILNAMAQSAIKETATIFSGAYLNALAKLLKMRLLISSPAFAQDMAGAIVNNVLVETSREGDYSTIIDTEFEIAVKERVKAYFFFIPDAVSLNRILKTIGMQ